MLIQWMIFGLRDALCFLEFPDSWGGREGEGVRSPDWLGKCREFTCEYHCNELQ